jgi:nicotinamidase-related amidase
LRDKRSELADAISRLERQADQHRADLEHITATMRLFDPNVAPVPETLQTTPPRGRNDWFRPGECRRRIHDVLRDAAGPMTTREIVDGVMTAKKMPDDGARTRELIHKTVLGSLNRATDTIERVEVAGSAAWQVI